MLNKYILILLLFLLIGSVSATEVYKAGDLIDLKQGCYNSGTFCSSATVCNITVIYPNATVLINAGEMSNQGGYFNYTLPEGLYTLGTYRYDITCKDGADSNFNSFNFDITPNGENLSIASSVIYLFMLILSICIFLGFTFTAIKVDGQNYRDEEGYLVHVNWKKYLKIFCVVMAYVTAIWLTWSSYNIILAYAGIQQVAQFFFVIHTILFSMLIPVIVIFCVFTVIKFVKDIKLQDRVKRGLYLQ